VFWLASYFLCGVFWWLGMIDFAEHRETWGSLRGPARKSAYVGIQFVFGMLLWPVGIAGWAITKGFFGKRAKANLERSTNDLTRELDERDRR
jgi:hypothetical protein